MAESKREKQNKRRREAEAEAQRRKLKREGKLPQGATTRKGKKP
jgi:hypothetical protein